MENVIEQIELEKLVAHPDNPNKMSKSNFAKLVRNIEKTGRYEPLLVRPARHNKNTNSGYFQIINGHHRWAALEKLKNKTADCIVWDIDDEQADVMLLTLNRLSGTDMLGKKLELLKRLNEKTAAKELAKFLPQTASQIERLNSLKLPQSPAKPTGKETCFANPLVFFVNDSQQEIIKTAIKAAMVRQCSPQVDSTSSLQKENEQKKTSAEKKAAALTKIASEFIVHR
ncbi:MAG: ParB-like nuclease domain-containing protein [Planctomycetes bacterium]|nr:ParB-like nuclease domain-containing protein [Planctomycetota bacterium]